MCVYICITESFYSVAEIHTLKSTDSQGYGFSIGPVWMWELEDKESWAPTSWCFWTVILEKTLESPLDRNEI